MATVELDAEFLALPLEAVRNAVLDTGPRARLRACRGTHRDGSARRSWDCATAALETSADNLELGLGLRVVHDGSFGFAATVELDTDAAAALADQAVATARATAPAVNERVELADEPSHGEAAWASSYDLDPAEVPMAEKVALLEEWSGRLLGAPGVDHVTADVLAVVEDKHYADLSGTVTTQRRVRVHPVVEAIAVDAEAGGSRPCARWPRRPGGVGSTCSARAGTGTPSWPACPSCSPRSCHAPSVRPGTYDLVIDPSNLWLTIHESIGHATELDRAMGYEAAYAGTSFATFDKLGTLAYGSAVMHVTGDRTVEHGLATVGYDDEGVEAQVLRPDPRRHAGRLPARPADRARSWASAAPTAARSPTRPATCRSSAWPTCRCARHPGDGPTTEELISAVEHGIYIVGDKSWSIDMQRYNFQFTGQRFFRIENGKLAGQVRDVAYQARTTDFWGAMEAVGGASTYRLGGAFNCGKGQPGQVAPVSHGCPSALFRGINVLNTRAESGR